MNLKLYGHPTHVRRYGKIDYLSKLKSSGFDVKMDTYVNSFSDLEVAKYGLDKNEVLFVCRKRVGKNENINCRLRLCRMRNWCMFF